MVQDVASDCSQSLTTENLGCILAKACENVASDLGLGGVFLPGTGYYSYNWLPIASHD